MGTSLEKSAGHFHPRRFFSLGALLFARPAPPPLPHMDHTYRPLSQLDLHPQTITFSIANPLLLIVFNLLRSLPYREVAGIAPAASR